MEKFFKLKENGTTVRTEVIAGITTFLAMAYILAVNPSMLAAAGMDQGAVFTATAVSAAFATLIMGVFANYPVALASGMGLNAYLPLLLFRSRKQGINEPWKIALTAVLVEGIIFIILSLFKFRETLVNAIPPTLNSVSLPVSVFYYNNSLEGAGITAGSRDTCYSRQSVGCTGCPCFGRSACNCGNAHFKVKGAILWGILITWVLGIIAQLIGWYKLMSTPEFIR